MEKTGEATPQQGRVKPFIPPCCWLECIVLQPSLCGPAALSTLPQLTHASLLEISGQVGYWYLTVMAFIAHIASLPYHPIHGLQPYCNCILR
jgi:hypothetical protein